MVRISWCIVPSVSAAVTTRVFCPSASLTGRLTAIDACCARLSCRQSSTPLAVTSTWRTPVPPYTTAANVTVSCSTRAWFVGVEIVIRNADAGLAGESGGRPATGPGGVGAPGDGAATAGGGVGARCGSAGGRLGCRGSGVAAGGGAGAGAGAAATGGGAGAGVAAAAGGGAVGAGGVAAGGGVGAGAPAGGCAVVAGGAA